MPRDFRHLGECAAGAAAYASWIHVDVMDGDFAPNSQWPEVHADMQSAVLPQDVSIEAHLMVREPLHLGTLFARAGAGRVMAHIEAFPEGAGASDALAAWKGAGAREAGLAIRIDTSISALASVASLCDFLQVMSIAEIGYQGKPFDERAISRVEELHALYPDMMVGVDGGVSEENVEALVRAGANRLVVGGAIMQSDNPEKAYADIHTRAMKGCLPRA